MGAGQSTSCRALAAEPVRQNTNGMYDIEATRKATVAYVEYKHSRTVGLKYTSCCINFRFTTIAYIIMTMRILIRNIDGGDSIW